MKKSGLSLSLAATIAVMGLSAAALAAVENDGPTCNSTNPDANGGCNIATPVFQDLGNLPLSNAAISGDSVTFSVTGHIGTYDSGGTHGSRDLDWFQFTIAEGRLVTFTLTTSFAMGGTDNVLFVGPAPDCAAVGGQPFFYGQQLPSPQTVAYYLPAGTYVVVGTSPFEADATNPPFEYDCGTYQLDIVNATTDATLACSTATGACDVAHASGGCDDYGCCEAVCAADPLCCDLTWNQSCVDNGAVGICGYFIYTCNATGTSPGNDCLTTPQTVVVGGAPVTVNFDTTNAKTDGPSNTATGAASLMGKDVWFVVKAPANGQLTVSGCAGTTLDQVVELYALGASPVVDTSTLLAGFIGQVDDTCGITAGPSTLTLIDAVANEWYLVRAGGFDTDGSLVTQNDVAAGPQQLVFSFRTVIYSTGPQKTAVAVPAGTLTNLGLSSGAIATTSPRRWYASPWIAPAVAADSEVNNGWEIQQIVSKGFDANAATTPIESVNWVIWKRTGFAAPVAADQLLSGSVPAPVPYDDGIDAAANASWPIDVPAGTKICPGDYYLTVYGARSDDVAAGGTALSNLAWFIYNTAGINIIDGNGLHGWRSVNFPAPGFVVYTGLNGVWTTQAGDDPNDIYNVSYSILGVSTSFAACAGPACLGDLTGDNVVDAADLGILLGAWGGTGPANLDGLGVVDAADLGILLGAWGPCP